MPTDYYFLRTFKGRCAEEGEFWELVKASAEELYLNELSPYEGKVEHSKVLTQAVSLNPKKPFT